MSQQEITERHLCFFEIGVPIGWWDIPIHSRKRVFLFVSSGTSRGSAEDGDREDQSGPIVAISTYHPVEARNPPVVLTRFRSRDAGRRVRCIVLSEIFCVSKSPRQTKHWHAQL